MSRVILKLILPAYCCFLNPYKETDVPTDNLTSRAKNIARSQKATLRDLIKLSSCQVLLTKILVKLWVLSQFLFCHILIFFFFSQFEFCHNLRCHSLSCHILRCCIWVCLNLSFVTIKVKSKFEFCHNLSFVTIWIL